MCRMFFCFVLFFVIWWLKMKEQTNNFLNWIELNLEKKKSTYIFSYIKEKCYWKMTSYVLSLFPRINDQKRIIMDWKNELCEKREEKNIYIMEKFPVSYILSPPFFYTCEMKGKQKKEWERAGKKEKKLSCEKNKNTYTLTQQQQQQPRRRRKRKRKRIPKKFSLTHSLTHT